MIRLELPWLPPTVNHAYKPGLTFDSRHKPHAKIELSEIGRSFKSQAAPYLSSNYPQELRIFERNKPYFCPMRFYFEAIENKGWAAGKAENRYKRVDASNRIKILEDSLAAAGGVDDSQFMAPFAMKVQGLPERTVIWVYSLEDEKAPGIDELIHLP
jgi:hypothetical protein